MIVPRASGLLRNQARVASQSIASSPRYLSATPLSRVKDDLGGPGGQQPPPNKAGGPEALRRNWVAIGGGLLALLAGYSYLSAPKASRDIAEQTKEQAAKTAKDMSGRNRTEQGGFRHE